MRLKRCLGHGYTLQDVCAICGKKTVDAHYRFVKIRGVGEKTFEG